MLVLPDEPVTPTTTRPPATSRSTTRAGEPAQRRDGVVDHDVRPVDRPGGQAGRRHRRRAAAADEVVAVDALARHARRTARPGCTARESTDGRSRSRPRRGRARTDGRRRRPRRPRPASARSRRDPRAAPRRSTTRSSNGCTTPATSWPGLVALAGDHHDVARPRPGCGRGRSPRAGRARPPAAPAHPRQRLVGAPPASRRRIASGSSERGLSPVSTTTSAPRAAIAPITGRLCGSRSPPAPSTTTSRPRRRPARGPRPAAARRRPACARSRRRRRSRRPRLHPLHPARDARAGRARRAAAGSRVDPGRHEGDDGAARRWRR